MISKVYLIRHGQTEWSVSGRHTGVTDVPLTAQGEEEARACGRLLQGISFQRVFTSPRIRARRTCELAGLGEKAEINDALREWEYGIYEGLTSDEILRQHPGWSIFDHGCPGGESPERIAARADGLISTVRAIEGTVALFSHGHFSRVFAARWVGLSVANAKILSSSTGSINILGFSPNGPRPVILSWNSSALVR